MSWSFTNDKPIFQQLVDIITLKIISGEYPTGSKLDAVRELVKEAGGKEAASCFVLAEGDAAERKDVIFLQKLPLFFK